VAGVDADWARLEATLKRAPNKAIRALAIAIRKEAQETMNLSVVEYVPIDNSVLRDSATVKKPVVTPKIMFIEFGYGGAAQAYAVRQHEDETLSHPPKYPRPRTGTQMSFRPGRAKYLEQAVLDRRREIPRNLADACERMFRSQGL
jgi:hypothetical protein